MEEPPPKRFKYASYNEKLRDISVALGRGKGLAWEKEEYGDEADQSRTPFTTELARLVELDLTLPFVNLQSQLVPLTSSLPITLYNLPTIIEIFTEYFSGLKDGQDHLHSGLDSALYLLQAVYETCLGEATPYVSTSTSSILRVGSLRALDPKLVERSYSTLSLIFRTLGSSLLKPDQSSQKALSEMWNHIRPYLRTKDNKAYVRKCVSEAWIGVVRKARAEGLGRLMDVMLGQEDDGEGMESIWAGSLKGTSGQLHSRALPVLEILLDRLRASPNDYRRRTVGRVVTALVHHCSITTITPVVEAINARIDLAATTPITDLNLAASAAMLHILAVPLFTRKGKRFPEPLLKPTMTKLLLLLPTLKQSGSSINAEWRRAFVQSVVGCLTAGKLAHWLSPGVLLIDGLWEGLDITAKYAFVNALVELRWAGIEQFLLPHIARTVLSSLDNQPLETLTLLNNLAGAGYFSGGLTNVQGGKWRKSLVSALIKQQDRLLSDIDAVDTRRQFGQLLQLLPSLSGDASSFVPLLQSILIRLLPAETAGSGSKLDEVSWREMGVWNDTHLLATTLRCADGLSANAEVELLLKTTLVEHGALKRLVKTWSWSREGMAAIAPFVERWGAELSLSGNDLQHLDANLMSADTSLRKSTLTILASATTVIGTTSDGTMPKGIWKACLQVESSEMTLKNVRERTSNVSRLARLHASLPKDLDEHLKRALQGAISYLVGQLKVNFRPLYPEIVTSLASLVGRHGELIWECIWAELEKTNEARVVQRMDLGVDLPEWAETDLLSKKKVDEEDDAEGEFRCRSLEKSVFVVSYAWSRSSTTGVSDADEVAYQISSDRLDVFNYESQLLASLAAFPLIAEKHSRLLIPQLFAVARHTGEVDEVENSSSHLSTRQLQQRTSSYLELLAKFVNPKAAFRSDELHALYLDILSKGEPKLQSLALSCLLTYKSANLVPYQDYLKALLEDAKFRDTLTHFQLGVDSEAINPEHRIEIVPVTMRLLYGIMTSRRGRSSTAQGLAARKQAVLTSMSGCTGSELGTLVDLMLEPFGKGNVAGRQQLGYLSLLHDVLRYLAPQTSDHWDRLLKNTIDLVSHAQSRLTKDVEGVMDVDGEEAEEVEEEDDKVSKGFAPLRNVRSTGIKRLVQFLRSNVDFDFAPYLSDIFSSIISPRLDKLEVENTQAPSGTLELIAALAASAKTARSLTEYDERTIPKTFACMTAVRVKPTVISRVFDIIDSLLADEDENDDKTITREVLIPHIRPLLDNIIGLVSNLGQTAGVEDLVRRLLSILSRLSSVVTDGTQAQQLATLLGPMLRQSGRQMPEKAKMNVLNTLQRLYAISPDFAITTSEFFTRNYDLVSNLFQSLFYPASRRALVGVLETFGVVDDSLRASIKVVGDINAYSTRRMEEPDFDRRLNAFASITDAAVEELPKTTREWLPLLRSVLFFIQEPEELSIRTNASAVLRRFIDVVGGAKVGDFVEVLQHAVVPGLKRALRSKLELVRGEALLVFSHAVKTCMNIPMLVELQPLLGQGEEDDTNFFLNISHIQVHRRARALRRLRDTITEHPISEASLSTIFQPILDHIIAGSTDVTDHHLINEAILTVGGIAGKLRWSRYNSLVMRYLRLGSVKTGQQKLFIRAVSSVIDHFHFDLGREKEKEDEEDAVVDEAITEGLDGEGDDEEEVVEVKPDGPSSTRISEVVLNRLLPSLGKFVAQKDEADDSVRIPLAIPTVKLASRLPGDAADVEILKTISTISQILRSKDQDTRDIARDTICKITVYLGPTWLVRVIKELCTALQRGPQKHVVAVVTHAILVLATTEAADRFGNLDEAVQEAVEISAEVIWGESGKDVANEGFKTKMREVRGASSRGFDTFQLVSRLVTPAKIGAVLTPLREIMHASQAVKTMLHVDETLRRVTIGLNANPRIHPEDMLNLVHSLISGNSSYIKPKRKAPKGSQAADSHRVQMKRDMKEDVDFYHLNAHKFVAFGLDLFVTAFRRGKFDFDNTDILSRLGPMVNTIGNTLYSPTTSVLLLGLKATAAIARCPLTQIEPALPIYIANIFKTIKNSGGTAETELAQTALKTLAVILRDCKSSSITDNQLKYLLEIITPDLEETDRQASIFAILRAIVSRKLIVPEIYDLMDRVSGIMITSQSTHVQEQCRGALMAFLLDYPQGEGRLKNQMTFLARNLSYEFESGRVSVMELLGAGLGKFSEGLIGDYGDLWFISLVQVLMNDDSEKCRNMAGALIRGLYIRFEGDHRGKIRGILESWVEGRDESPGLGSAALGVYGLLADVEDEEDLQKDLIRVITPVVVECAGSLRKAETSESVFEGLELDYAIPNYALSALAKAIKTRMGLVVDVPWESVVELVLFPHDWVRFAATRCLVSVVSLGRDGEMVNLLGGEEGLLDVARKGCIVLRGSKTEAGEVVVVDGKLADQIVKLLFNISKHWVGIDKNLTGVAANSVQHDIVNVGEEDEHDEDAESTSNRPLAWIMSRMSFIARHLIVNRPTIHQVHTSSTHWTVPLMATLRFFAGIYETFTPAQASHFLVHVLTPLHRILDENGDIPASEAGGPVEELRNLALEVREFVQAKVGTSVFSKAWEGVRRRVTEKREVRRDARNRLAVVNPQGYADRKGKRVVMKKDSKKRRTKAFAEGKIASRPGSGKRRT